MDTIRVKTPGRFRLDEKPQSAEIRFDFGSFSTRPEIKFDGLTLKRELVIKDPDLGPADRSKVLKFFKRIDKENRKELSFILD